MITYDSDYNIRYSYGDTLALRYNLGAYALADGDVAVLSIKRNNAVVLDAQIATPGLSVLDFVISAADMAQLPIGSYVYDMYIQFADERRYTTHFAHRLSIVEVAHNVTATD